MFLIPSEAMADGKGEREDGGPSAAWTETHDQQEGQATLNRQCGDAY